MKQQKEADDYLQFLCQTFTVSNQYTNHDAVALTHMRLSWNKPLDSARLCTAVRRTTQRSFKDICTLRFKHGKQPLFFEVLASKDQRWLQHWHVYYSLDILLLVFFFYLYVFVKIKEIFSCTPSCSHFFAALKKKEILVTCPNSERPRERTCPHRVSPSDWQLSLCPAAGVSPGGSPTPAGPGSHLQAIQHNSISTSSASAGDVGHDLRPGH